ncbi:MAG: MBOAT family protein [Flavobacteriales bacterium]|jgi:D-alanyl-lipoteichoic acid acyltransferase DltB (MBOAT superfamily)|nr:MBOAT family protein [Flavobacteriales bacterium]
MLFNSLDFALFLPIVFLVHWLLLRRLQARNAWLLFASYVFYGWWDPRFLSLIALSSLIDFLVANQLGRHEQPSRRKALLWTSITANLGMLAFFKYHDFFISNIEASFSLLGHPLRLRHLDIILPVGISFYTFQTLSYTIDVYRRRLEPSKDLLGFLAYVSFFPQLVAGPIERATNLLPQFSKQRDFSTADAVDGLRQMLWGLAKKVLVADSCAPYVDSIFDQPDANSGSTLLLGAVLFSFQIYCDFSGYSDIAIGCARLFGFELMRNFAYPYFARDIAEFWRRWHISLSTWFRDYVYVPLGGSRGSMPLRLRNTLIVFLLSGFWHGANWTFICWGAIHALYFIPLLISGRNRTNIEIVAHGRMLPSPREAASMLATFLAAALAWVFFRASDVSSAVHYIGGILDASLFTVPTVRPLDVAVMITVLVSAEWLGRAHQHPLQLLAAVPWRPVRWALYYALIASVIAFAGAEQEFIYFQF